ncbi:MAG: 5-formyltetrahydrofolate cyclo-ligase [Erysipelotrichaceae bacterium]|nr:5-formyltetrahydrofolate cyclo-ligase [Erysipelotrichaceae bacterium]
MSDKKQLRKICIRKRNDLSKDSRIEKSEIICRKLLPYLKDRMILSYCPFNSEVDVSMINKTYRVALPVINKDRTMEAYVPIDDQFVTNFYGIKEPDINRSLPVKKEDIDVIIVPLLGFDRKKNRLGYGGGYYDRYLEDYKGLKIGVAFRQQEVENIETDKNDVRLDIIITDTEIIS